MKSLNEDLKSGQLNNVYLLYGEEAYLKKQYRDKLRNAIISPDDNMNYAYYLNIIKARQLEYRSLLVMDESHVLENEMIKAGTIRLTEKICHTLGLIDIKFPKEKDSDYEKRRWLFNDVLPKLREQYLYYKTGKLKRYYLYDKGELVDGKYVELDENGTGYYH